MVWIVSSGISTGLHVAAGILDQILTSVGMNGKQAWEQEEQNKFAKDLSCTDTDGQSYMY